MQKQKPFSRFLALAALVNAAMAGGMGYRDAIFSSGMGDYKSRGKGRGGRQASRNTNAQLQRASTKARNRAKHKARA